MKSYRSVTLAVLLLFGVFLPLQADNQSDTRRGLIDQSLRNVRELEAIALTPASLGEWRDIIQSSLELVFRRTELYRGTLRIMVVPDTSILVTLYPEGTIMISTGLLDYIDGALFESAADSARRMRSFDSEREAMLVPFVAVEAAHFALDHPYRNYASRSAAGTEFTFQPSSTQAITADAFAAILLDLAGYDRRILETSLKELQAISADGASTGGFNGYLSRLPSPGVRLRALTGSSEQIREEVSAITGILTSLRTGTAWDEALEAIKALDETYPGATYFDRLRALVLHRQWLDSVPATVQGLKTLFPIAAEEDPSRAAFVSLLAEDSRYTVPTGPAKGIPGNALVYEEARIAYAHYLAAVPDTSLEAPCAMLRYWSSDANTLQALTESITGTGLVERTNLASLIYLSGMDNERARNLVSAALAGELVAERTDRESARGWILEPLAGADERDAMINLGLMLRTAGNAGRARAQQKTVDNLVKPKKDRGTLVFRQLRVGDTIDELVAKWGKPAEIIYNFYTENWLYPSMAASVQVSTPSGSGTSQVVTRIRLNSGSPVSPAEDIRVGDSRADFEARFGKPAYRAGDCEVYLKDGNRISVLYLADTIRMIMAGL